MLFILLLCIVPVPSFGIAVNSTKKIFVDDDNILGPWDGTREHPFKRIQDAINDSENGSIIYIYSGIYFEKNLVLNKSLEVNGLTFDTTIGNDSGKPVVDAQKGGYIFKITSSECTIRNIITKDSGKGFSTSQAGFVVENRDITIENCEVIGVCYTGIFINNEVHPNIRILNNTIHDRAVEGIYASMVLQNAEILGNSVYNCYIGIELRSCSQSIVQDNILSNNARGLLIHYGGNNIINGNIIENSHEYGLIIYSNNAPSEIVGNILRHNHGRALFLNDNDGNTVVKYNNIYSNYCSGIESYLSKCEITMNTIENNTATGIIISSTDNAIVKENNIFNNHLSAVNKNSENTVWLRNYWDRPRILPYIILGLPSINIDWHPAKKPYDIPSGR